MGSGEQMNRNSLSKILALVFALVCTGYQNTLFAQANSGNLVLGGSDKSNLAREKRQAKESFATRCDSKKKAMIDAKAGFQTYCKSEFQKKMKDKTAKTQMDGIKSCSDDLETCANFSEDEQDFQAFNKSMSGAELMPFFPYGSSESKRCSKYTVDKLESAIDKAQTALDTKKKDKKELVEKATKSEQDMQKELQEMQKKLLTGQKDKAKEAKESKETERNQESAYKSKQAEYSSQMDKIRKDIAELQQQQALLMTQRGQEINVYKMAILECKRQTKTLLSSNAGQTTSNLTGAGQSDARVFWASCTERAMSSRKVEGEKFKLGLDGLNMNIQYKYKELAAVEQAGRDLEKMYNEAKEEQANYNMQQDQAFINDQRQIMGEMDQMANNIRTKAFQNSQFLQEAETQINQASNKLRDYESQEARGNKSLEEAGGNIAKYAELKEDYEATCGEAATKKFEEQLKSDFSDAK